MKEQDIQSQILIAMSQAGACCFRINAGSFWSGEILSHDGKMLLLKNPRKIQGAPEGFSDIVGVTTVTVTPQMVGRKIGVFTCIEVKKPGEKPKKHQENFLAQMRSRGAIAGVARSPEEAVRIING